jgi:hypothetical protein
MAKKTTAPLDDGIVLRWLGGPDPVQAIHGVPARDLTEADVERIAYVRAANPSLPQGSVVDDLLRSGLYARGSIPTPPPEPDVPADPAQER